MSIILTKFPITANGIYFNNFFKAFVKELIELKMQDESSCSVTDSGGFVKLSGFTDFITGSGVNEGETIVIIGGDYQPAIGIITVEDVAPSEILTDIPYIANATVRFFIRYANLRMTYRFTDFGSGLNDQSATNLFGTNFIFYPDNFGQLYIDISLIKSLLKPNFDFENAINTDMSISFQVQYQINYDGSSDSWHSANDLATFVPFISAHAGGRNAVYDYYTGDNESSPDNNLETKMWRGYKKLFSTLIGNDNMTGNCGIYFKEYDNAKAFLGLTAINTGVLIDGIYNTLVPTLDADTRYLRLEIFRGTLPAVYHTVTIYDTLLNKNEYYLTWVSELSSIRNWLFTAKLDFNNKVKYDILQDSSFRQIPNSYEETILLQAKGLSEIDKNYLYDIYLSNKIQLTNDSEDFECVVSRPSFSFENRSNSYICTIEIQKKQRDLMNG